MGAPGAGGSSGGGGGGGGGGGRSGGAGGAGTGGIQGGGGSGGGGGGGGSTSTPAPRGPSADLAAFRALPVETRVVDHMIPPTVTEAHADGQAGADRLAAGLSGRYGEYYVNFTATWSQNSMRIRSGVFDENGNRVGQTERSFNRDRDGKWSVHHDLLALDDSAQGSGFSREYYRELMAYYRRSNLTHVDIQAALSRGGYAWARQGFTWDPRDIQYSVNGIRRRMEDLIGFRSQLSASDIAQVEAMIARMQNVRSRNLPTPQEIAEMVGDATDPTPPPGRPPRANGLGVRIMQGSSWYGILYL